MKMNSFPEKFERILDERDTILCVGLDPALPSQRDKNTIPSRHLRDDDTEARLNFCLSILDQTAEYCIAAKPNREYVQGLTLKQHRELTDAIHSHELLAIYDCKLGDIGSTAQSGLFHYKRFGYDAVTVNPFPGNLDEIVEAAHGYDPPLGIITWILATNPESVYLKEARVDEKPLYVMIAEKVKKSGADGSVIGATGHVTKEEIKTVREIVGEENIFLVPGVGAQCGDEERAIKHGGKNLMINVGRSILYAENPRKVAEEYCRRFNRLRETYT